MDSGAQVSSISSRLYEHMTLKVHALGWLLELEGTRGSAIPYLGYIEVNLQIPGIKGYNEDVLLLAMPTMNSTKVPVIVESKIIDRGMGMMTKGELMRATVTWKQAHFGAVMSRSLQLPCTDLKGNREAEKGVTPSEGSDPTASRKFCLDDVWGLSVTLRGLPFPHLGLSAYIATQTSRDNACASMCLLNQHKAPSCLPSWS